MTIGFNYERYRFYTDPTLDSGSIKMVTKPSNADSDYTPSTAQNKLESEVAGKLFSGFPSPAVSSVNILNKITELNFYGIT